jgi:hypothetical protein
MPTSGSTTASGATRACRNEPRTRSTISPSNNATQRHNPRQPSTYRPPGTVQPTGSSSLVAIVGIALLIFGLIEAELRHALGDGVTLPGLLPEHRAAIPTSRAVLAAFTGLHLTYTPTGPVLDQLTTAQRTILAHLDIPLPWQEQQPQPRKP